MIDGDSRFRLVTLGGAHLLHPDGSIALEAGVPLAVLVYLHAAPRRTAGREHLATTFWGSSDQAHARQALRQNIARLRSLLGSEAFQDHGTELTLAVPVTSDRDVFLDAIAHGNDEAALQSYGGEFVPGFAAPGAVDFEHWLDAERARLRILFLQSGEAAVRRAIDRASARDVVELARRLNTAAGESESVRRLLLEVLLASGDPGARVEAESLLRWLKEEDRAAEPATLRLVQLARDGREVESTPVDPSALKTDLVGRGKEFHAIVSAWRAAAEGPARHVHVEAPAGLGKTRLLEDAAFRIRALGGKVVCVRARPGEQHLAFAAAADLAAEIAALPGSKAVSSRIAGLLVGLHPGLASVFPNADAELGEGDQIQQRALALHDLIHSVAEECPLAMMLDDVQWLDDKSRQVLSGAVTRLGAARVLCLTAGRPGRGGNLPGDEGQRLLLSPLTLQDTEGLLESLGAFSDPGLRRRLAFALQRSADGSPMRILEGLQFALESNRMGRSNGVWKVEDADGLIEWLGQQNVLESRLAGLSTPARRLLLALAATGAPLAKVDIERAVASGTISPETLLDLERRGFITPRGERWDLAHDEVGETILRVANDPERLAAHAALGRALLARGADDTIIARRATRHLIEAHDETDLKRLFRGWVRSSRKRHGWISAAALARELLGDLATQERVDILLRSLPAPVRWPLFWWGIAGAVVAASIAFLIAIL